MQKSPDNVQFMHFYLTKAQSIMRTIAIMLFMEGTMNTPNSEIEIIPRFILLATAVSYIALGMLLGFTQGGLAPILRSLGVSLAELRWVYVIYLPFGLAFLWSPMIDAWRLPWLGRRSGWIVSSQLLATVAMLMVSFLSPSTGNWVMLMLLGLVATFAAATADVALDALNVDLLPEKNRAMAAGLKMGGLALGTLIGGGALVAFYPQIGWHGTFGVIVACTACSCLPILALVSKERRLFPQSLPQGVQFLHLWRDTVLRQRLLRLSLLVCTLLALFNFNRLLLVDMGVSLERIGTLLGTTGPFANALAALIATLLLHRLSIKQTAWLSIAVCLVGSVIVWLGAFYANSNTVIIGSITVTATAAGLYVVLGSLILAWAKGTQAATDYALLYGVGRFIGTFALIGLPALIQSIGWNIFLAFAILAFAISALWFMRIVDAGV